MIPTKIASSAGAGVIAVLQAKQVASGIAKGAGRANGSARFSAMSCGPAGTRLQGAAGRQGCVKEGRIRPIFEAGLSLSHKEKGTQIARVGAFC